MDTTRYPYIAPERKHDAYGIPSISEVELDGLRVYHSTSAPIDGVIIAYPNIASAEAALGVKNVRAASVWELIKTHPGVKIDLRQAEGA